MHPEVLSFVAQWAPRDPVSVLDIGGRDLNGTNRDAFTAVSEWLTVDLRPGTGVDIVADAAELDLGRTFDVVVCTEVLEHAERWRDIIARAADHVAPGGSLIVTCAGPGRAPHSGVEARPDLEPGEWYANVSAEELRDAMEAAGLEVAECRQWHTDTQAVGWRF